MYRRLLKAALEELELIEKQIGQLDQEMAESAPSVPGPGRATGGGARARSGFGAADYGSSGRHRSDLCFRRNLSSWVGACPGDEETAGVNYSPRSPKGNRHMRRILNQAANAAVKQRKHLRGSLSPQCTASGTQSNHRGDCPSALSLDLEDSAPRSRLRGTGPDREQKVEAEPREENDPRASKSRLPGRITESSTP